LNLQPFLGHGKLLLYHGWADQNITPLATINYYNGVAEKLGGTKNTMDSMRLFMVPGMGHCRGGEGPDTFDVVGAMEQWVEKGKAPENMIASHNTQGKVDRTRPLCPYPQVAKYKGTGSTDDAANFVCKTL
jgi:feruloyl esterase